MENPKTLIEAVRCFSSLDACQELMISIKWPDGRIVCPKCNGDKIGVIASRRKFDGEVESDETYVGGKAANMHAKRREKVIKGRGAVGKTIVHGLLQRGNAEAGTVSQVKATVVPDTDAGTLLPAVYRGVESGTQVYTDAHASYSGLFSRYLHDAIDHATEYVSGRVHINGMENFWSLLKRALKGSYVHVAPFHLERYVDEEVFRFNERAKNDWLRFWTTLKGAVGRRLTYRELCAIDGAGFMGIT